LEEYQAGFKKFRLMNKKAPVKSIIILCVLLLMIWVPFVLKSYDIISAISITVSTIIAGFIGSKILEKAEKKES
tara:strand:- start:78 stop:299 length:222 start_codon:yes stop_codon:yes gene_type:complete